MSENWVRPCFVIILGPYLVLVFLITLVSMLFRILLKWNGLLLAEKKENDEKGNYHTPTVRNYHTLTLGLFIWVYK